MRSICDITGSDPEVAIIENEKTASESLFARKDTTIEVESSPTEEPVIANGEQTNLNDLKHGKEAK